MKPFKVFLFFLVALTFILLISFYFSGKNFVISSQFKFKVPDFSLFIPESIEKPELQNIIHSTDTSDFTTLNLSERSIINEDTLTDLFPAESENGESDTIIRELEYPQGDISLLFPFFNKLTHSSRINGGIRILYYGDSQIEGDRITSFLRHKLQMKFGGMGPGLISARMVVSYTQSVQVWSSSNWRRYTLRDFRDSVLKHNRLGLMMNVCRYTLPGRFNNNGSQTKGVIRISGSGMGFSSAEEYRYCRLLLGNIIDSCFIELKASENYSYSDTLEPLSGLNIVGWQVKQPVRKIEITLRGKTSPDVYGIALDGTNGVAVDNIPMRGSSGTDFTKTDTAFLRKMYSELNVELLIFHFGVNVAMNVVKSYKYYENLLFRELSALKMIHPDIPIIVIGISDMNISKGIDSESINNLEAIRTAQKKAAFRTNCIFWDLYKAMGGKNSMKKWVTADPPLGKKDQIHFSYKGANKVAEMFYEALMQDYATFSINPMQYQDIDK